LSLQHLPSIVSQIGLTPYYLKGRLPVKKLLASLMAFGLVCSLSLSTIGCKNETTTKDKKVEKTTTVTDEKDKKSKTETKEEKVEVTKPKTP